MARCGHRALPARGFGVVEPGSEGSCKPSWESVSELETHEVLRIFPRRGVGGGKSKTVIQAQRESVRDWAAEIEAPSKPVVGFREISRHISDALLPVVVGKKRLQAQVFDDLPVDARTEVPDFIGIRLDAETDLVSGAEGIGHGGADFMADRQIGVPGIQVRRLIGLAGGLELIKSVAGAGQDGEIRAGLPVRVSTDAVTR